MPNAVAISYSAHAHKSWLGPASHDFVARDPLIPIGMQEVLEAVPHLPIAFIQAADGLRVVVALGFEPNQNLIVNAKGQWLSPFRPVRIRTHPFTLAPLPSGDFGLCLWEDSGLVGGEGAGQPFFTPDGALYPIVQQVMETLIAAEKAKAVAVALAKQLFEAGVICPWEIMIPDGERKRKIEGLFRIDEEKFRTLDDETYLKLRRSDAITLAYCQLISMQNLGPLVARYTEDRRLKSAPQAPPVMELDFSSLAR
jgi:hypothetical protein